MSIENVSAGINIERERERKSIIVQGLLCLLWWKSRRPSKIVNGRKAVQMDGFIMQWVVTKKIQYLTAI